MDKFAAAELHISVGAEPIFHIGPVPITNSMLLGSLGFVLTVAILFYAASRIKRGKYNRFVGLIQWVFEGLLNQINDVIPDVRLARRMMPLAVTIFFFVLINYWLGILPGVGSITFGGVPLLRSMTADLNFTLGLTIVTVVVVQAYAIKYLGTFGNLGRYFKNPFKSPIGAFEGILEFIGEFSRGIALTLRLFGNAFAGEILLLIVSVLTGYFAALALPVFMAFELFIGFIQAYVFFILTLIFTSLATSSHGSHDHSPILSAPDTAKE